MNEVFEVGGLDIVTVIEPSDAVEDRLFGPSRIGRYFQHLYAAGFFIEQREVRERAANVDP